ncbi:hypothetical protein P6282_15905 [Bacillus velezensis]|nr:hypothetical protein P6282_15905 [Bacillus velezensis]
MEDKYGILFYRAERLFFRRLIRFASLAQSIRVLLTAEVIAAV